MAGHICRRDTKSKQKEVMEVVARYDRGARVHRYFLVDSALTWVVAALALALAGWACMSAYDALRLFVES